MRRSLLHFFLLLFPYFAPALGAQTTHIFDHLARTRVQYLDIKSENLVATGTANTLVDTTGRTDPDYLAGLRQTLINLPAFVNARWSLDTVTTADGISEIQVRWEMTEGRTLFPIVNLGGIEGNTFYQIGFNDIHFRGRGQELTAFYQNNNGEHNFFGLLRNLAYRNSRWGYALEFRRYAAVEPVFFTTAAVDYRYINTSYGIGGSYTFPNRQVITFGGNLFRERYRKTNTASDANLPGPDAVDERKYLVKLGYWRDRIDRFDERNAGTTHSTSLQLVRTFGNTPSFWIGWHEFRAYRLVGNRGNLAGRLRAGLSSNGASPFAPFVLDSQVNIRGSGNRIDRGTAQLILNLEYRHTVYRDKRSRYAAQLVSFSDLGTWRNPGGALSDLLERDIIRHFVGAGIRLQWLKAKGAVLRVDYGMDVRNMAERGFVVGVGQYF